MSGLLKKLRLAGLTIMANYNPNLVKINRSYTYEELAAVFNVHKNTVAAWVKNDLPCLKEMRPFLILGADAKHFLQKQRSQRKQTCKLDELFCMRCKVPTKPFDGFVEYAPLTPAKGRLTGFCSLCDCEVNKFVGVGSLASYAAIFDLRITKASLSINDSTNPI